MAINCEETGSGEVTITLEETFDFNCVEQFRNAYEGITARACKSLVVDLRRTHYMDSSALGMLINMQKFWQDRCSSFRIINTNPQIRKIFTISRFDKKFTIE
jgi:anti-anti-sigma factor